MCSATTIAYSDFTDVTGRYTDRTEGNCNLGYETQDHFENLAEFLGDNILDSLGTKLSDQYTEYKESRGDWEQSYREGLELLGFKYERRTEPFRGASGVNHPVLAEAVTQFQAQAYKELLPADGPVRTQVVGAPNEEKTRQAQRVKDYIIFCFSL